MKLAVIEIENFTESDAKTALALLPEPRRAELLRLHSPADFSRSLLAELALRLEIMQNLRVFGDDIQILRGENQKPRLKNFPNFHFNISHSGDFSVCAFDDFSVGVDVEKVRPIAVQKFAARLFTPREQAALEKAPDPLAAFFRLWTAKESVVKQRGTTLARDLRRLEISGGIFLDGDPLPCRISSHWLARGARVLTDEAGEANVALEEAGGRAPLRAAGEYALSLCRAAEAEGAPKICFCTAGEILENFLNLENFLKMSE